MFFWHQNENFLLPEAHLKGSYSIVEPCKIQGYILHTQWEQYFSLTEKNDS